MYCFISSCNRSLIINVISPPLVTDHILQMLLHLLIQEQRPPDEQATSLDRQQSVRTRLDGGKGYFHRRWGYRVAKKTTETLEIHMEPSFEDDSKNGHS